jgi:hypothetical protein
MGNLFSKTEVPKTVDKAISTEQNLEIDSIKKFIKKILAHEDIENKVYERLLTMLVESINDTKIELEDHIIYITITPKIKQEEYVVNY